jgi:hypothetical protein
MEFITKKKEYRKISELVLGLFNWDFTMELSRFQLKTHLTNLAHNNPLATFIPTFSANANMILPRCKQHAWSVNFRMFQSLNPSMENGEAYKKFIRMKKLEQKTNGSKLCSYIKWSHRSIDNSILFKDHRAFNWRCNYFRVRDKCICRQLFNRKHVNVCKLLDNCPEAQRLTKLPKFTSARAEMANTHFSVLDFAINHKYQREFSRMCDYIDKQLELILYQTKKTYVKEN